MSTINTSWKNRILSDIESYRENKRNKFIEHKPPHHSVIISSDILFDYGILISEIQKETKQTTSRILDHELKKNFRNFMQNRYKYFD